MPSVDERIIRRIRGRDKGWCFTPVDFLDLGSRQAVDTALFRLTRAGRVTRACRGVYTLTVVHPRIGLLHPSADAVAAALARKSGLRLQATGAHAANLLGLSTQVPMKVVFLTDGPKRRVVLGNLEILFKTTTPRFMATAGRISGTVIQALRYIGKANITSIEIRQLRKTLSPGHKRQLLKDKKTAPAWMHRVFEEIASDLKEASREEPRERPR